MSSTPSNELRVGRKSLSNIFAAGHRSETDGKEALSYTGLQSLDRGLIIASFQIEDRFV